LIADAAYWIKELQLSPHPEGGYYRVTYTSQLKIAQRALPAGFHGDRAASTAIYFLLAGGDFSAFHRIASDELWHFYAGSALQILVIDPEGALSELRLDGAGSFQAVVPGGCWFASRVVDGVGFALVGCTVAPGFDFADFELAKRHELVKVYPQHRQIIEELTRL
jgi:predicted cupin superfamily sugar epimerase